MIVKVQFSLEAVQEVEVEDGIVRRSLHDDEGGKIQAVAVYDEHGDVIEEFSREWLADAQLAPELAQAIEDAARRANIDLPPLRRC